MKKLIVASLAAVVFSTAHAQSVVPPPPTPVPVPRPPSPEPGSLEMKPSGIPGKAEAKRNATMTVTIQSIDVPGRTLTVRGQGGRSQTVKLGPEVTRLKEFSVGDTIRVDYEQGLALEFQPPGSPTVLPESGTTAGRTGRDQLPGSTASSGIQATVTITAIDTEKRLVSFQGEGGKVYQVKASPMIRLEKLKVGDRLLVTYVETVAIRLQKTPRKK